MSLTRGELVRSLGAVVASVAVAGIAFGMLMPLMALRIEAQGYDGTINGLNAATGSLAVLVVGPFVPHLLGRFGVLPTLYAAVALGVAALVLMPVLDDVWAWFPLRFAFGLAAAVHWIVSETWINTLASERNRGRVIGAYITLLAAGFALGPVLVRFVGIEGAAPFLVAAAMVAACAVPLWLARGLEPPAHARSGIALAAVARRAPALMAAAFAAGFIDTGAIALLPLYGLRTGFTQEVAVLLLAALLVGNCFLQMPLGWLADRFDRRAVLGICGALNIAGASALPFVLGDPWLLWPLLFVWGGAAIGIYTVALTILGQSFRLGELAAANAAMVMAYEAGSVLGPGLAGAAMDRWEPHGFAAAIAAAAVLFTLFALFARPTRTG